MSAKAGIVALGSLVAAEVGLRAVEERLPVHDLWHDALPALHVRRMAALRRRNGPVDFVIAGSSIMHSGVDPAVVAQRAPCDVLGYNASLHRGFYDLSVPWLVDTVIPVLEPRLVVLAASVFDLNDNGEALWAEPAKYRQSLLGRSGRPSDLARELERHSAVFRHHRLLRRPRRLARSLVAGPDDKDRRGSRTSVGPFGEWTGFHDRSYLNTPGMWHHVTEGVLGDFVIGPRHLEIIEARLEQLLGSGVCVVLTTFPVTDDVVQVLPNGRSDVDSAVAAFREIGDRLGIPVVDPDARCLTTEQHYADLAHLNRAGTERFSHALGNELRPHLCP